MSLGSLSIIDLSVVHVERRWLFVLRAALPNSRTNSAVRLGK